MPNTPSSSSASSQPCLPPLDVLLVDDDRNICRTLNLRLKDLGASVREAHSVAEAIARMKEAAPDLILSDFRMEGQTGLDLTREARALVPDALVIVMTAFASFENAVAVVKEGAFDYLPKPFTTEQLLHVLRKAGMIISLRRENSQLKRGRHRRDYFAGLTSTASRRLEEFVRKVAPTPATLLLVGESGTGKSELARLIHDLSPRREKQFITVDCTTLAESLLESELFGHVKGAFTGATQDKTGKLEAADGGTLFLDEIGDMSPGGQAKLLRFLQDRVFEPVGSNREIEVDTRIIAATNRNLEEAVTEGRFRQDLYYRLNILECPLVPLRFRKEDVPVLTQRFVRELSPKYGGEEKVVVPDPVRRIFERYPWPGNVRELHNVLERALMLSSGKEIREADLPEKMLRPQATAAAEPGAAQSLEQVERLHIEKVLASEANLEKAAEILGITTVTLWRKRKQYGLA